MSNNRTQDPPSTAKSSERRDRLLDQRVGVQNLYEALKATKRVQDFARANSSFGIEKPRRHVNYNNSLLRMRPQRAIVKQTLVNGHGAQKLLTDEDFNLRGSTTKYFIQQQDIQNNMYYRQIRNQEHMNTMQAAPGATKQFWRHASVGPREASHDNGQASYGGDGTLGNADSSDFLMTERQARLGRLKPLHLKPASLAEAMAEIGESDRQVEQINGMALTGRASVQTQQLPFENAHLQQNVIGKRRNTMLGHLASKNEIKNRKYLQTERQADYKTIKVVPISMHQKKNKFERTIANIQQAKYREYNKSGPNMMDPTQGTSQADSETEPERDDQIKSAMSQMIDSLQAGDIKDHSNQLPTENMSLEMINESKLHQQYDAAAPKDYEQVQTLASIVQNRNKRFRSVSATGEYSAYYDSQNMNTAELSQFQNEITADQTSIQQKQGAKDDVVNEIEESDNEYQSSVQIFSDQVDVRSLMNKKEMSEPAFDGKEYLTQEGKNMMTDDIRAQFDELNQAMGPASSGAVNLVSLPKVKQSASTRKKYTYEDFLAVEERHAKEAEEQQQKQIDHKIREFSPTKSIHMLRRIAQSRSVTKGRKLPEAPPWPEQQHGFYTPNRLPALQRKYAKLNQTSNIERTAVQSPKKKMQFVQVAQRMESKQMQCGLYHELTDYYRNSKHIDLIKMQRMAEEKNTIQELGSSQGEYIDDDDVDDDYNQHDYQRQGAGARDTTFPESAKKGKQGSAKQRKPKAQELAPDASHYDLKLITMELDQMSREQQTKVGIYGLDRALQIKILMRQKSVIMDRTNFLINDKDAFLKEIDRKIEAKQEEYKNLDPKFNDFVRHRLLNFLDLKKRQIDKKNKDDQCIFCEVKLKIKVYLEEKEVRDAKFTKNPFKDKVLRKQLEYIDRQPDWGGQQKPYKGRGGLCSHFETMETIVTQERMYLRWYMAFFASIRMQPIIRKRDVIQQISQWFYSLQGLSPEEREVYQNRKYFRELLTSPWIRIVKNQLEEEVGVDGFYDMKSPEEDPVFAKIGNLEVRKICKEIYQLYLDAPDDEPEDDGKLLQMNVESVQRYANRNPIRNVEKEMKKIRGMTKELRSIFKDQNIRRLCAGVPATPKAEDDVQSTTTSRHAVQAVFGRTLEKQNFYSMNKNNQNCCHTGAVDEETGVKNEDQLQFDYMQTQSRAEEWTLPGWPVPQTLLHNGRLELIGYHKALGNSGFEALSNYLSSQQVKQMHLEDNNMKDNLLRIMLESVLNENYHHFTSFYYSKGALGEQSIDALIQIIQLQNMSNSQRSLRAMNKSFMGSFHSGAVGTSNDQQKFENVLFQTNQSNFQFDSVSRQASKAAVGQPGMSIDRTVTGGMSGSRAQTANQDATSGQLSKPTSALPTNEPPKPKPMKKVEQRLRYLSLHHLRIQPQEVESLFQQLTDTNFTKLIELNLSHFSLNDGQCGVIVGHLCNFLQNQSSLIRLHLTYTQLKASQLLSITDTIIENEMFLTLQDLNFSYNIATTTNAKLQDKLESNFLNIIKAGEKLTHLDFSNMGFNNQLNLRIAQTVAEVSASIQVFQISHNSTNTSITDLDHIYYTNSSANELLKTFSIPWSQPISKMDQPSSVVLNRQKVHNKQDQAQMLDYLVDWGHSRGQRVIGQADMYRPVDFNQNHLVFYRHLSHAEQVFVNPPSCAQKSLKYLNHLNWKVSNENVKGEQYSHVLFIFDKDSLEDDGVWQEIPKSEELMQRFDIAEYDLDNPLICYDGVVSPMIHAQVYSLFCFLNNEELYNQNFANDRIEIYSSILQVQRIYYNMIKKQKMAKDMVSEEATHLKQAILDQIKAINQKCVGWSDFAATKMLDLKAAYFTQVVGAPEKLTEAKIEDGMQEAYMYSAYIKHSYMAKTFIVYDPTTDKMYRRASPIDRKTQKQREIDIANTEKRRSVPTIPLLTAKNPFSTFILDQKQKLTSDVQSFFDLLSLQLGKINEESMRILNKFYPMLIDVYNYILSQILSTSTQIDPHIINTEYLETLNQELLAHADDEAALKAVEFREYFEKGDSTKFADLKSFIRSLIVIFKNQPDRLHNCIKSELVPLYSDKIKTVREEIMKNPEIIAELENQMDTPLRYKVFMEQKLTGKLNLGYLKQIFLDEGGMSYKGFFKVKVGKTYQNYAEAKCMELFALSKLRQTQYLNKEMIYKYCLDFDEFVMFICQLANYMKASSIGPKIWAEWSINQIVESFVKKLVAFFKVKLKRKKIDADLGPDIVPKPQKDDDDSGESSDENYD